MGNDLTRSEVQKINAALFDKLQQPGKLGDEGIDAVNSWLRMKIRGLTKRGLPERSISRRILPPMPMTPDGVIPEWETGALLHEIIESLEFRAECDSKKTARELWYELSYEWRRDRRHRINQQGYDKYQFGMKVATSLLSQIRNFANKE